MITMISQGLAKRRADAQDQIDPLADWPLLVERVIAGLHERLLRRLLISYAADTNWTSKRMVLGGLLSLDVYCNYP